MSGVSYSYAGMVVVFFLYGLAFFLMGFAILGEALRPERSRLAATLLFLAAYGLIHGVVEWVEMFDLIFEEAGVTWIQAPLAITHHVLLPLSLVPLLFFGVKALADNLQGARLLWSLPPSLVIAWLLVGFLPFVAPDLVGSQGLDLAFIEGWQGAWARYLLYLPGCLLSALGLFVYRRYFLDLGMPTIARYATLGGSAFVLNAVVAGLVVPEAPFPPAYWLNYGAFTDFVQVPPQIFRAVCAILFAFAVVGMLRFFKLHQQQRLAEAQATAMAQEERARRQAEAWGRTLEREVTQRTQQLEALARINAELSSHLDLENLLHLIVEKACDLLRADVATISLLHGEELVVQSTAGVSTEALKRARMAPGHGMAGKAMSLGEPVVVEDYPSDRRITHELDIVMEQEGLKSFLAVPLKVADKTLGALFVATRSAREFGQEDVELLSRLAQQASIALENARLYQQVKEMAALTERERLAREMHDSLAQSLGLLRLQASQMVNLLEGGSVEDALRESRHLEDVAEEAHADVREAILGLRSTATTGHGLIPMLRDYLATFSHQNRLKGDVLVESGGDAELSPQVEVQVMRVAQEALTNVRKHAGARGVKVTFAGEEGEVRIAVKDDGRGFDPAQLAEVGGQHFGLSTMKERIESVGGRLQVRSAPGQGTEVVLWVPTAAWREVTGNEVHQHPGRG